MSNYLLSGCLPIQQSLTNTTTKLCRSEGIYKHSLILTFDICFDINTTLIQFCYSSLLQKCVLRFDFTEIPFQETREVWREMNIYGEKYVILKH